MHFLSALALLGILASPRMVSEPGEAKRVKQEMAVAEAAALKAGLGENHPKTKQLRHGQQEMQSVVAAFDAAVAKIVADRFFGPDAAFLVALYKELHAAPELSLHEEKTAARIAQELRAAGCEVTERVGQYEKPDQTCFGVVGILKNGAGPTVAVRTDLDGLPVLEETELPYASKVFTTNDEGRRVPVMHACGHDTHMASFIGTARALAQMKEQWHGTVVFIGQPAEENVSGAKAMLKDGLYTRWPKPDFVLGFHDEPELAYGEIGFTEGYCFANVDAVDVTVHGIGGHGAYPHKTKDPIALSAQIIEAWQTIASRQNNPLDPVVITVGSIHGGTRHNIIADEVKMQLTVRTYKAEVREKVLAAIERTAKGCAVAAGLPADKMPDVTVREDGRTSATYNNPELTRRIVGVFRQVFGDEKVVSREPQMGGEDFNEFSLPDRSIPAFMFRFGTLDPARLAEAKKSGVSLPSLHSSKFAPVPEPTLRTATVAMTSAVLELLRK